MELTQAFLGERIARAREGAGLSQGALAELVGLTQSAISRIEAGERSVESLELARLAKELQISVLDLLEERPLMEELLVAARADATESASLDRALNRVVDLIRLEQLVAEADESEKSAPLAEIPPTVKSSPVAEGEWLAKQMRELWNLDDDPMPNNFESLIEDLSGLSIALEPVGEQVAGLCARVNDAAIALVDSSVHFGRQRFTVAHELCHFLQRDMDPITIDERLTGKSNVEKRANTFAAHFLMPERSVQRYLRDREPGDEVVIELVYTFGVSLQAILWHLFNLGLISKSRRKRIAEVGPKTLSMRYGYGDIWQRLEAERGIRRPPRRLRERATSAYERGLLGIEPLADLLGRQDREALRRELEDQGIGARESWWEETTPT